MNSWLKLMVLFAGVVALAVSFHLVVPGTSGRRVHLPKHTGRRPQHAAATIEVRGQSTGREMVSPAPASDLRLPLSFEANQGQTDRRVKFLAHGDGFIIFLTPDEVVLTLRGGGADSGSHESGPSRDRRAAPAVLRLRLRGTEPKPHSEGLDELPGKSNYFIGNDRKKWRTDVPTYEGVNSWESAAEAPAAARVPLAAEVTPELRLETGV
jgi:hypothetical protein